MAAEKLTAKLSFPGGKEASPGVVNRRRARGRYPCVTPRHRIHHARQRVHEHGSTTSSITYLDGEAGVPATAVTHRRPRRALDFVETSYLPINGKLPNKAERSAFSTALTRHSLIHEDMHHFFSATRRPATDGRAVCDGDLAVGVLPRLPDRSSPVDLHITRAF
jgi:hypothetical protein